MNDYKLQVLLRIRELTDSWIEFDGTTSCYQKMNDGFVKLIEYACLTEPIGEKNESSD